MAVDRRAVLRAIEGRYLRDYALFTGALREYVVRSLEKEYARHATLTHRRLLVVNVFREEYSAYEDLGATLDAMITHTADPDVPLLERLAFYGPGEVQLARVMSRHKIANEDDLYRLAGFEQLVSPSSAEYFPGVDLRAVLRRAARFFFIDCVQNQKPEGIRAFNKVKHGLLWVPSGRRYVGGKIDGPAALFGTDKAAAAARENPLTVYTVSMTDDGIGERLRAVHFVQACLRLFALLRVIAQHPTALKDLGYGSAEDVMALPQLLDVVSFVEQVTGAERATD